MFGAAGYMLTEDPDTRPDIFQVSFLAFQMARKNCPVPNMNVSPLLLHTFKAKKNNLVFRATVLKTLDRLGFFVCFCKN